MSGRFVRSIRSRGRGGGGRGPSARSRTPKPNQQGETAGAISSAEESNAAVSFLARQTALKKTIDEEIRKLALKSFVGTVLNKLHKGLAAEDKTRLAKQGDAAGICKSIDKISGTFNALKEEWVELDHHCIDAFE